MPVRLGTRKIQRPAPSFAMANVAELMQYDVLGCPSASSGLTDASTEYVFDKFPAESDFTSEIGRPKESKWHTALPAARGGSEAPGYASRHADFTHPAREKSGRQMVAASHLFFTDRLDDLLPASSFA
jgi:hypothetical protein